MHDVDVDADDDDDDNNNDIGIDNDNDDDDKNEYSNEGLAHYSCNRQIVYETSIIKTWL
jgi:hypothetical protein